MAHAEKVQGERKRRGKSSGSESGTTQGGGSRSVLDKIGDITLRDVAQTAKVALDLGKEAMALLNAEEKVFENKGGIGALDIATTGAYSPGLTPFFAFDFALDQPTQGVQLNQRTGNSVEGHGIDLSVNLNSCSGAGTGVSTNPTTFRFMVIRDNQPSNPSAPNTVDDLKNVLYLPYIFQDLTSPDSLMCSQRNYLWEQRFSVLLDETVTIDPNIGPKFFQKDYSIRHKQHVDFDGTSSASNNCVTHFLIGGFNPLTALYPATQGAACSGYFNSRFKYTDN